MQVKKIFYLPLSVLAIASFGCSANNTTKKVEATASSQDTTNRPVETAQPNTNYPPAFVGQTRIKGVKTTTPYTVERIASNIGRPWAVVPMPGNKLLITDKTGFMQVFSNEGTLIKKITGFPEVEDGGQGGLRLRIW